MVDPLDNSLANGLLVPPVTGTNDITRLFQDIEKKGFVPDTEELEHDDSLGKMATVPYSVDYKPPTSENKRYVYSINELLSYSKEPASDSVKVIIDSLPKKKFWRFGRRFSDQGVHKNIGQKNGNRSPGPNNKGKVTLGDEGLFDRKNSKGKNSRAQHSKRGSKFGKNDKNNYLEEKDIAVNNDDLLALEEDFEPTGNSMADFESWRAKMKEMERKKKGIKDVKVEAVDNRPILSSTSSSISDFLKLNNKNEEPDNRNIEINEKKFTEDDKVDKQSDTFKGASRFSSFFTQSSSNVSLPSTNATNSSVDMEPNGNVKKPVESNSSGSRLMSFFNKTESQNQKTSADKSVHIPNDNEMPRSFAQPVGTLQGQHTVPPLNPNQRGPPPAQQSQTNNLFFQGLLNRGKMNESNGNPVSTSEIGLPTRIGNMPHPAQAQPPLPHQSAVPPGFPMGIQNVNFPPSYQARPNVPPYMVSENSKTVNNSKSADKLQGRNQPPPGMPHHMGPGMAPPGFPPMQGLPPHFNPAMYGAPNAMMQPVNQHFYPPIPPPPGTNINLTPFQIPNMSKQQDNRPHK